jgi:transposase
MAKWFRPVRRDETLLLPPDMRDWLPADHLVWFVIATVDALDLSAFTARPGRRSVAGRSGYDPRLLLAVLVYAYALGVRSSREIERRCHTDVAFRVACADDIPDHTTVARFRQRHEAAFTDLFGQVLALCGRAGLGDVSIVAIDGTKIAANAAAAANRSEAWWREQAERAVKEAADADAAEDAEFGAARGDEPHDGWADPSTWPTKIRAALADFDADDEAADAETAAAAEHGEDYLKRAAAGTPRTGRPPARVRTQAAQAKLDRVRGAALARAAAVRPAGTPGPGFLPVDELKAVRDARAALERAKAAETDQAAQPQPVKIRWRNRTDLDSRLMPTRSGWLQGFNAQLAVSNDQIILAAALTQTTGDEHQLTPMITAAAAAAAVLDSARGTEQKIGTVLADAGYLSEHNLTADGPDRLIAVGKRRQQEQAARDHPAVGDPPAGGTPITIMEHRLRTPEGLKTYRRRGAIVEPVNGHLKDGTGLRRFARRGLTAANSELQLASATLNLLKIYRTRWAPTG